MRPWPDFSLVVMSAMNSLQYCRFCGQKGIWSVKTCISYLQWLCFGTRRGRHSRRQPNWDSPGKWLLKRCVKLCSSVQCIAFTTGHVIMQIWYVCAAAVCQCLTVCQSHLRSESKQLNLLSRFYHDTMLAWYMPLSCLSFCLSQAGVLLKWLNVILCKQCHTVAQGLILWCQKYRQSSNGVAVVGYQSTRHRVISSHGHVVTRSTRHRSTRHRHVSSHSQVVTSEHITKPPVPVINS